MNKKGIFLAVFAILVFIGFIFGYSMIMANKNTILREFNIGSNEFELINAYYQAEQDLFNLDQKVKYSSFKAIKEFSENGAVDKTCNKRWKFNDKCEPNLKDNFLVIFKEKMKEYNMDVKNVRIENNFIIGDIGKLEYIKNLNRMNFTYKTDGRFNESLKIDFKKLDELKEKIKTCIQDGKKLDSCADGKKNGDIFEFKADIGKIFYGSKFEDITLAFEIDSEDSGVVTNVF